MEDKIFKEGINFKCQNSGNCCVSRGNYGYVYLTKKDIKRISIFFKISVNFFKKKYCEYTNGYLHLKEIHKNGNCQFLYKNKCNIYKVRPTQCRTWPFWNENMNAKGWNNSVLNFCPGIGKGKKIKFDYIKKLIKTDIENEKKILRKTNK